jgi:hypothetical protein
MSTYKILHHALLKQLQEYEADHGCVVCNGTKTGKVRAIANLEPMTVLIMKQQIMLLLNPRTRVDF